MNLYFIICLAFLKPYADVTVAVSSSVFKKLATSSVFVDKTMLIQHVLNIKHNILITAPPKFGKSTNINMIRTFLEIEVDEFGDPKTKQNITNSPVNDTENFLFFKNSKFEITKHPRVMNLLGRAPVVHLDFKKKLPSTGIRCLYDAIKVCKEVIHDSYRTHEYLLHSPVLTLEDKQIIRTWCDEHSYKTKIDNLFMSQGLPNLSRFLYKHFRRKVFVLVDNHDFLVTQACYDVEGDVELRSVVELVYGMINDVVAGKSDVVRGVYITGVSQLPETRGFNATNVQTYKFLENHSYSEFFGFTKNEVDSLISKSEFYFDEKEITLAHKNCNGYLTKRGVKLYNLYSVLMFLKLKRTGRFFTIDDYPSHILKILKEPPVRNLLNRVKKEESIEVENFNRMSTNDVDVRNCFRKDNCTETITFLLYFLNWGLITYTEKDVKSCEAVDFVKIPNNDIREFLSEL